MKRIRRLFVLISFFVLVAVLIAFAGAFEGGGLSSSARDAYGNISVITSTHARAGGGEDFGGGGFDSFDSGSSFDSDYGGSTWGGTGGSGGSAIGTVICIIIVIAVIIAVSVLRKKGAGHGVANGPLKALSGSAPAVPPEPSIPGKTVQADIGERKEKLAENDPDWNEDRFLDVAETIFFSVQEGWTKKELNICRPYLSDSVYNRFKKQLADLTNRGLRNVCENIVVGSTEIVKVEQDKNFDSITIKFRASMRDYKIDEKTGKVVEGSTAQTPPFTEYWTFVRKAGLKTREAHAVQDKKCPNCGAPLEINESGVCKYCKANVVSGNFDWVLSKITQRDEWRV